MTIKDRKIIFRGAIVCIVLALFFMYEFFLRTIVGTFQLEIQNILGLSLVAFSIVSATSYQLAYGSMQIPVGFIITRIGLKKSAFLAALICALSSIFFGLSNTFAEAVSNRVFMGFGSAFGFICLLVAIYEWMPRKYFGLLIGLSQSIGTVGPMVAAGPINSLTKLGFNYRDIFIGIGVVGFIIASLIVFFVKNNPRSDHNDEQYIVYEDSLWSSMKKIFRLKQAWFIGAFSGSVYFVIEYLSQSGGMLFIKSAGYSMSTASYMISLLWLGYAVGCPLLGLLSDFIQRRKAVMVMASVFSLIGMIGVFYFPEIEFLVLLGFLLLGIGTAGQSIGFAAMAENCQKRYVAAGLGFNNGVMMIFCASSGPLVSFILTKISGGKALGFTLGEFQMSFLALVAMVAVSFIVSLFFIRETFCNAQNNCL